MAYNYVVVRYNSYGKECVPRRRVLCLSELQRGDHIAFDRFQGRYFHHAIVKHVDQESGEIKTGLPRWHTGKVQGDLETGRIDQKGYDETVRKRVVTGASRVAGSTIGIAAGQALIPVPAVGAVIGGVAGALVGGFLGNLTGNIIYF